MKNVISFLIIPLLLFTNLYSQTVTWTETQPAGNVDRTWSGADMSSSGSIQLVRAYGGRIYISVNNGASWTETQPAGNTDKPWYCSSISSDGSIIIAGAYGGRLYISTNSGNNWVESQPIGDIDKYWICNSVSSDGSIIISGTGSGSGRLYISTNSGSSWIETQPVGNVSKSWVFTSMNSDGSMIIAGAWGSRIYLSTDVGDSWTETQPAGNSDKNWRCTAMNSDGSRIVVGVNVGRLYLSTNSGSSWSETQPAGNMDKSWFCTSMSSDGSIIIAGVNGGRLYISTNSGSNWTETQPAGNSDKNWRATSVNSDGTKAIVGVYSGRLYVNDGPVPVELSSFESKILGKSVFLTWQTATEIKNFGFDIERSEVKSGQANLQWVKIGFVNGHGNSNSPKNYCFKDENIKNGKFKYRLKQIDIDGTSKYSKEIEIEIMLPNQYLLSQNYPNPFNPTTNIQYAIGSRQFVSLKLYDVLGKEIKTLVDEEKEAGYHSIDFNASNLPSGVYFYQLKVGGFVETRKMILLR